MSIFLGEDEIKDTYVGVCKAKEVYIGTTKIFPIIKDIYADFLLIGGGGVGGVGGGGGGAGGVIQCCNYCLSPGEYPVVVGPGGNGYLARDNCGCSGCDSCFNGLTAYGGGGGAGAGIGISGGSGGGGGYSNRSTRFQPGRGCSGQGYNGSYGRCKSGGGGGGAGGNAQEPYNNFNGGIGGVGIQSDISGTMQWYAGGGSGIDSCYYTAQPAPSGGTASGNTNVVYCGAGSGARHVSYWSNYYGGNGIFILRYPTACGYNVSGGCKYTCGDYTIHCFTSDGTLTIG